MSNPLTAAAAKNKGIQKKKKARALAKTICEDILQLYEVHNTPYPWNRSYRPTDHFVNGAYRLGGEGYGGPPAGMCYDLRLHPLEDGTVLVDFRTPSYSEAYDHWSHVITDWDAAAAERLLPLLEQLPIEPTSVRQRWFPKEN